MTVLNIILTAVLLLALLWIWRQHQRIRAMQAAHRHAVTEAERTRAAEASAQADRTRAVFDGMVEGVIVLGPDSRVQLANRAAANLFGFPLPATGRTMLEAVRNHEVAAIVARLERESEVLNHELRLEGASAPRFVQVNALALHGAVGTREGTIVVFHELTRIRQLESLRQDFVANVSHELRTPLSLIKSAAETLLDGARNDPATATRFLEIIEKNAGRLTLLLDDLLLLAGLDSGRIEFHFQSLALRAAAQESLDDAAPSAHARSVMLHNEVPEGLSARADPERLRQALANLVDNAIKYGRVGGRVTLRGRRVSREQIEISVRDDGPGIPPEAQARIFERFFRVDKARSREQGGTGLGLAIVKNIVLGLGGEIRVESIPGAGAEFFIKLPCDPTPPGA